MRCCCCRKVELAGPEATWTCSQMRPGATCRTSANDWGRSVRSKVNQSIREQRSAGGELLLSPHFTQPLHAITMVSLAGLMAVQTAVLASALCPTSTASASPAFSALPSRTATNPPLPRVSLSARWQWRQMPPSSMPCEYIPGRDVLYAPQQLAAGLDAYDSGSREHILCTTALPRRAFDLAAPLVLRGLQLFQDRQLPESVDGRSSAGAIDLAAYLVQPHVQEATKQALHRRRVRLQAAGAAVPRDPHMMQHVVHVSPDARKVYVGDEHDVTKHGGSIMVGATGR